LKLQINKEESANKGPKVKPVKTAAQILDIQNRWKDRRINRLKVETPEQIMDFINTLPEAKDWFKNGFNELKLETNPNNNGSTTISKGIISLKKERMDACASAITKTRLGNIADITEKEAESMATFWHEITHNGNNIIVNYAGRKIDIMELANEFVARKTLPEFYKALGSDRVPFEIFMSDRRSTMYNPWVKNYDELIQLMKLDTKDVVDRVRDHLFNKGYDVQIDGLVNGVKDSLLGKKKSNGTKVTITDVKDMVRGCIDLGNTTDYTNWLRTKF